MASQAQIDANRINAQSSTGPQSPEAKARVALNPLTHGLARANIFLPGEAPAEFVEIRKAVGNSFRFLREVDTIFIDEAALAWWKIRRISEWQVAIMTSALEGLPVPEALARMFGDSHEAALKSLHRYETSARGALHRALNQLRALQKERDPANAAGRKAAARATGQAIMKYLNAPIPGFEEVEARLDARDKEAQNRAKPISGPAGASETRNSETEAVDSPANTPPKGR
jgi:hypothetical protein